MDAEVTHVSSSTARVEAFRRLVEGHLDDSYRLARAIVGPADAEDAVHDAFEKAWRRWSSLRDPELFNHWFYRILLNTCRSRARRMRWLRVRDISAAFGPPEPTDGLGQALDRDLVGAALLRLAPDERIVIALRFYSDLTIEQIAGQLGLHPGTVKSRLHYAMRRLQIVLDDAGTKGTKP